MDDLLGEDWQSSSKPKQSNSSQPSAFASNYSSFRASPTPSQTALPPSQTISRPSSTVNSAARTPAQDQFGGLLSLKSQKPANTLSLLEQQQRNLAEKKRQQEQQAHLWDSLGSGHATPEPRATSSSQLQDAGKSRASEKEEDILAAFNKSAPVNKASHFPPPSSGQDSGRGSPAQFQSLPPTDISAQTFNDDDDDPFGLSSLPKNANARQHSPMESQAFDEDDILGDLGKPVESLPQRETTVRSSGAPPPRSKAEQLPEPNENTSDQALAELVDMGFPSDNAKVALSENEGDIQRAVGWLLQQAHEQSRQKAKAEASQRVQSPAASERNSQSRKNGEDSSRPSWMREDAVRGSSSQRTDGRSPVRAEKDAAQMAQDLGSKLFKGANSLWKAGQKQMTKTIAEFQQDRDASQPKWMQESASDGSRSSSQGRANTKATQRPFPQGQDDVTDEAAMLDMPRDRPTRPAKPSPVDLAMRERIAPGSGPSKSTAPGQRPAPSFVPAQDKRPTSKLSRQDVEEQSAQAYVSPARRKKATPVPTPPVEPEVDLFSSPIPSRPAADVAQAKVPANQTVRAPATRPPVTAPRPQVKARDIPSVSPAVVSASAAHRKAGGEAFKRGDFASAHESYTAALSSLPPTHPIVIVVLSNRCLTALKTGDAKSAVADADRALAIVGPGQGIGESIELGPGEGAKEMRDFYGKAITRKAEALEHLERWSDAAAVWRQAIAAGVGGAISIRGRDRCEKAASPQQSAPKANPVRATATKTAPSKVPIRNGGPRPATSNAASGEAVKKLRAANAAAEKADDEKFALSEQVDARLTAWKGGKADNLRALLQSLDNVLWAEAGWKKVGMSDLVLPNKVKIIYMKAIAKVHPDKIPQNATTEQRMISGAVFSTLNEAWDKFKKDNNL